MDSTVKKISRRSASNELQIPQTEHNKQTHDGSNDVGGPKTPAQGRDEFGSDPWKSVGGYMTSKVNKLRLQNKEIGDNIAGQILTRIFTGVSIYVNGYTVPSNQELKKIIHENGGIYEHFYTKSKVTHIIANVLPTAKIRQLREGCDIVVRPEWITDSVLAGFLLPIKPYQLYATAPGQHRLAFKSLGLQGKGPSNDFENDLQLINTTTTNTKHAPFNSANVTTPKLKLHTTPCDDITMVANTLRSINIKTHESEVMDSGSVRYHGNEKGWEEKVERKDGIGFDKQGIKEGGDVNTEDGEDIESLQPIPTAHGNECTGKMFKHEELAKDQDQSFDNPMVDNPMTTHVNPDFIQDYYKYSRLSHLSRWGVAARTATSKLVNEPNKTSKLSAGKCSTAVRRTMHIDMDSFFVSASLLRHPTLSGQAVAVCHSRGNGVGNNSTSELASCNYKAREYGLRNGMYLGDALKLCPGLVTIPYYFNDYQRLSEAMYTTVLQYTNDVQGVSADEVLVEVGGLVETEEEAVEMAQEIRSEIYKATQCKASVGIGANILQARLATRKAKPDNVYYIKQEEVSDVLGIMAVGDLPGVGWSTRTKLEEMGVTVCLQLKELSLDRLQSTFGLKIGQTLYNFARGIDNRELKTTQERKSVSTEISWGIRFTTKDEVGRFISDMANEVEQRLVQEGVAGSTVTLKIKERDPTVHMHYKFLGHGPCHNHSRSQQLAHATCDGKVIARACMGLYEKLGVAPSMVRGVGIQLTRLVRGRSKALSKRGTLTGYLKPSIKSQSPSEPISNVFSPSHSISKNRDGKQSSTRILISTPTNESTKNLQKDFNMIGEDDTSCLDTEDTLSASNHATRVNQEVGIGSPDVLERLRQSGFDITIFMELPRHIQVMVLEEQGLVSNSEKRAFIGGGVEDKCEVDEGLRGDYKVFPPPAISPSKNASLNRNNLDLMNDRLGQDDVKVSQGRTEGEYDVNMMPLEYRESKEEDNRQTRDYKTLSAGEVVAKGEIEEVSDWLPQASQIDPAVFSALPMDMQKAMLKALRQRSNQSNKPSLSNDNPGLPERNLNLHLVDENQVNKEKTSMNWLEDLPPPSQWDSSYKRAIPSRYLNETVRVIKRHKKRHDTPPITRHKPMPNMSRKALKEMLLALSPDVRKEALTNYIMQQRANQHNNCKPPTNQMVEKVVDQPALDGAVDLIDVRVKLSQWVQCRDWPGDDDVVVVADYLVQVVHNRDLERVDGLIRYIALLLVKYALVDQWKWAYDHIVSKVQDVMFGLFGQALVTPVLSTNEGL